MMENLPKIYTTPARYRDGQKVCVGDLAVMKDSSSPSSQLERKYLLRITGIEHMLKIFYTCITTVIYYPDHVGRTFEGQPTDLTLIPREYIINDFPREWLTEVFQNKIITDVEQLGNIDGL